MTAKYTFFSCANDTFSRMEHMLGNKIINTFIRIKKIKSVFSDPNALNNNGQQQ